MDPEDRLRDIRYAMNTRMMLLIASVVLITNAITSTLSFGFRWMTVADMVSEYEAGRPDESAASAAENILSSPAAAAESTAASITSAAAAAENTAASVTSATAAAESTAASVTSAAAAAESAAASVTSAAAAAESAAAAQEEPDIAALTNEMAALNITVNDLRGVGIANIIMGILQIVVSIICVLLSNRVDKARITFTAVLSLAAAEAVCLIFVYFKNALSIGTLLYTAAITGFLLYGAFRIRKMHRNDPARVLAVGPAKRTPRESAPTPVPKRSIRDRAMMAAPPDDSEDAQAAAKDTQAATENAQTAAENLPIAAEDTPVGLPAAERDIPAGTEGLPESTGDK